MLVHRRHYEGDDDHQNGQEDDAQPEAIGRLVIQVEWFKWPWNSPEVPLRPNRVQSGQTYTTASSTAKFRLSFAPANETKSSADFFDMQIGQTCR